MTATPDLDAHTPRPEEDDEGGIDPGLIRDYLAYVTLALKRHKLLATLCFLLVTALAVAVALALPPTYHVQARILAQRNQVIAALGNPSRQLPSEVDAPTRAAAETVLQHDSVLMLIQQTALVDSWQRNRRFAGRVLDDLRAYLRGVPSREDIEDALVTMVEQRLRVWTTADQVVVLDLYWPDADTAYRLVQAAQENFLENRHRLEIAVIAESISMLEEHAADMRTAVDSAIEDYRQRRANRSSRERRAPRAVSSETSPQPSGSNPELTKLALRVAASRRAVTDLEDYRDRRVAELQSRLAEQRATYADSHPSILNLQQSIEAVSRDSPSLIAARKELEELEAHYARQAGEALGTDPLLTPARAPLVPVEPVRVTLDSSDKIEPQEDYARQRMNAVVSRYNTLLGRVDAAHVELDAARAAFKYRYVVVQPARRPKRPSGNKAAVIIVAGAMAGLGLAVLGAVMLEIRRGRLLFPWQVERTLGLPILASARRP